MRVCIDCREAKLITHMQQCSYVFETAQLCVGDIHIYKNDDIVIIIERKTYPDLYSSIIDGRYAEQKARLSSYINPSDITPMLFYLLEGPLNYNTKICKSAEASMLLGNFKIIKSDNIEDTANYIMLLANKFVEKTTKSHGDDYVSLIKSCKKDNMTPDICYIMQLACIPGISVEIAKTIKCNWGTMQELCYELETHKIANIALIKCGKTRKLGKVLAERIIEYLHIGSNKDISEPIIPTSSIISSIITTQRKIVLKKTT